MQTRISENVAQIIELALSEKVGEGDILEWDVSPVSEKIIDYPYREQSVSIWVLLRESDGFTIDTQITIPMRDITDDRIKEEIDRVWQAFTIERLETQF